jgi:hypothetical protein
MLPELRRGGPCEDGLNGIVSAGSIKSIKNRRSPASAPKYFPPPVLFPAKNEVRVASAKDMVGKEMID